MWLPIALVLAFIAVVVGVQSVANLFFAARDRTQRVNRRVTLLEQGVSPEEVYASLVRAPSPGSLASGAPGLYERAALYCRQAGVAMAPERLAIIAALLAFVLWIAALTLVTALTRHAGPINALLSLVGAISFSVIGVVVWLRSRHSSRQKVFEGQLPLALDIVIRALRAGHPVVSAVQLAAEEMGDPIGSEFGLIVDETSYGLEFKDALLNFARRTGSADAHYFAVSVGIQSETGGNLAEILSNLAGVIRDRQSLQLRVKALSSEGKMSAQILSVLPVLLISWFLYVQPTFYTSKFDDPVFWPAVGVVAALYVLGQIMINRIINFKY
jgi:tight adherence protein B